MKQRCGSGKHGFTLLEVLVATSIMAVAVATLLSALSASVRNASRVSDHDRAALLAKRTMDELLLNHALPLNAEVAGDWDRSEAGLAGGWRARVEVHLPPKAPMPGQFYIQRILLEVWWNTTAGRRTSQLEAYRRAEWPAGSPGGGS